MGNWMTPGTSVLFLTTHRYCRETLVHSDAIAQALIAALQEISLTSNETNMATHMCSSTQTRVTFCHQDSKQRLNSHKSKLAFQIKDPEHWITKTAIPNCHHIFVVGFGCHPKGLRLYFDEWIWVEYHKSTMKWWIMGGCNHDPQIN